MCRLDGGARRTSLGWACWPVAVTSQPAIGSAMCLLGAFNRTGGVAPLSLLLPPSHSPFRPLWPPWISGCPCLTVPSIWTTAPLSAGSSYLHSGRPLCGFLPTLLSCYRQSPLGVTWFCSAESFPDSVMWLSVPLLAFPTRKSMVGLCTGSAMSHRKQTSPAARTLSPACGLPAAKEALPWSLMRLKWPLFRMCSEGLVVKELPGQVLCGPPRGVVGPRDGCLG